MHNRLLQQACLQQWKHSKACPLAEVRQIINHKIDLQFTELLPQLYTHYCFKQVVQCSLDKLSPPNVSAILQDSPVEDYSMEQGEQIDVLVTATRVHVTSDISRSPIADIAADSITSVNPGEMWVTVTGSGWVSTGGLPLSVGPTRGSRDARRKRLKC